MKNVLLSCTVFLWVALLSLPCWAQNESPSQGARPKVLMGTPPVNVNISAAGSLPKGVLFTALNTSFAEKNHTKRGYRGSDAFAQVWLLKIRYGLTDNIEISTVGSYVNIKRSNPTPTPKHLDGFGDQTVGVNIAPFNIHQGDPFALSFVAAAMLPTGSEGANHLPGNHAWGWRLGTAYGLFLTPNLKFDTEAVWTGPFERGNRKFKRGQQYQWNSQMRYLFQQCDIALESNFVHLDSGDLQTPMGTRHLRNGYTEWFVGPSANIAFEKLDMWAGVGVFFPVYRETRGPAAVENARFEFKIGKLW